MIQTSVPRLCLTAIVCLSIACAGPQQSASDQASATEEAAESSSESGLLDPGPRESAEVEEFLSAWLDENDDENGVFHIPERRGLNLSGTMSSFHTVHQADPDTYSVCVDFQNESNIYDVDFLIDRTDSGLVVAEKVLHKVNGEVIN